jgi:hypothetical protein
VLLEDLTTLNTVSPLRIPNHFRTLTAMAAAREFPTIKAIRSFVIAGVGSGGDYHNVKGGHW